MNQLAARCLPGDRYQPDPACKLILHQSFPRPHQPVGEYLTTPVGGDLELGGNAVTQRKGYRFGAAGNPLFRQDITDMGFERYGTDFMPDAIPGPAG